MASHKNDYNEWTTGQVNAPQAIVPAFQRFVAFIWFFLLSVPLILFVLAIAYQVWEFVQGRGLLLDVWSSLVMIPLGLMILPVFFYLGWYYQARAKNKYFVLNEAMYGHFLAYCRAVYGVLAGITIILTIIGILGSALIDSSLILVSLIGTAFVGIGIISWLFQGAEGEQPPGQSQSVSLKPTGIVLILFSFVWLYVCISSLIKQDWVQLEGGATLFLVFLLLGIVAFRLSDHRIYTRSETATMDDDDSLG